jgi:hypothetical protein
MGDHGFALRDTLFLPIETPSSVWMTLKPFYPFEVYTYLIVNMYVLHFAILLQLHTYILVLRFAKQFLKLNSTPIPRQRLGRQRSKTRGPFTQKNEFRVVRLGKDQSYLCRKVSYDMKMIVRVNRL